MDWFIDDRDLRCERVKHTSMFKSPARRGLSYFPNILFMVTYGSAVSRIILGEPVVRLV